MNTARHFPHPDEELSGSLPAHAAASRRAAFRFSRLVPVLALATLALTVLAACSTGNPAQVGTPTPTPTRPAPTASPEVPVAPLVPGKGYLVKVFFSKHPDSDDTPTLVFPVDRYSPDLGVATYAIQQLIAGPAQAERQADYYSALQGRLSGTSTCGGADFKIALNMRGSKSEAGTATLQFCRTISIPGELAAVRMTAEIEKTLLQFSAIQRVVILTKDGGCFNDLSGRNQCLVAVASGYPVQVFFSKHPDSDNNPAAVFPLRRVSPDLGVAAYAVKQLIAGPTQDERNAGYYSALQGTLSGASTCNGADFKITLDMRASKAEMGTATLQFCRTVLVPGELAGARMAAEVQNTLLQFPTIQRAVILTKEANCFNDLSGRNLCLAVASTSYPVKVFFSKHPDSDSLPRAVFPVSRVSPDLGVATFAIKQLIAGPTTTEQNAGYFTPLQGALSGSSTCGGADFTLTLNMNRTTAEPGTATLQFCRAVKGLGDTGAIMARNEIHATLTQFPTIQREVILYQDGSCFDDLIGCEEH